MESMDIRLYEFVNNLRLKAHEYENIALDNEKHRPDLTIKMVGMMYAYREIADKIEDEFCDLL
jgi:hypothetical protein